MSALRGCPGSLGLQPSLIPRTSQHSLRVGALRFPGIAPRDARPSSSSSLPRCSSAASPPSGGGGGGGAAGDASSAMDEAQKLTSDFMRFVAETAQDWPTPNPFPTALMPPTAVVKAQMDALMRNDWPEPNSGVRAAFKFALPQGANEMIVGDAHRPVRTWEAAERYLSKEQFEALFYQIGYSSLVNCESWEFCSQLTFHRRGDESALQAVRVKYPGVDDDGKEATRERVYTFILQKVVKGPHKGCWMVIGVRLGDYANV